MKLLNIPGQQDTRLISLNLQGHDTLTQQTVGLVAVAEGVYNCNNMEKPAGQGKECGGGRGTLFLRNCIMKQNSELKQCIL